jgi:hypothetical protein
MEMIKIADVLTCDINKLTDGELEEALEIATVINGKIRQLEKEVKRRNYKKLENKKQ